MRAGGWVSLAGESQKGSCQRWVGQFGYGNPILVQSAPSRGCARQPPASPAKSWACAVLLTALQASPLAACYPQPTGAGAGGGGGGRYCGLLCVATMSLRACGNMPRRCYRGVGKDRFGMSTWQAVSCNPEFRWTISCCLSKRTVAMLLCHREGLRWICPPEMP